MLTQREVQNLLDQINQRFDHQSKLISKLEDQVQKLSKPSPTKSTTRAKKEVEENA